MVETITIERSEEPRKVVITMSVPDDGTDLPDVTSIKYNDEELSPVDNRTASEVMEGLNQVLVGLRHGVKQLEKA